MRIIGLSCLVVAFFYAKQPFCCSCSQGPFSLSEFDQNDFIFVGKVVSFEPVSDSEAQYGGTHIAEFLPVKTWKGRAGKDGTIFIECNPGDGCGMSYKVGSYYFECNYGKSHLCDFGRPLNADPAAPEFNELLKNFISSLDRQYGLDEMALYYKKYGSLERYYSRVVMTDAMDGERKDFYARELPLSADPDTVSPQRAIIQSTWSHGWNIDSVYTYFETGELESVSRYKKGKQVGWEERFASNGDYRMRRFYDDNGAYIISEQYTGNGILFYRSQKNKAGWVYDKFNEKTGALMQHIEPDSNGMSRLILYRENGAVYCTGSISYENTSVRSDDVFFNVGEYYNIKGQKVIENGSGHFVEWHNDSVKAMEAEVLNGVWYGEIREWNEDGSVYSEEFYHPPGDQLIYHNSDIDAVSDGYYQKHGLPYGVHRKWSSDGELRWESIFDPGAITYTHNYIENGVWKQYVSKESVVYSR